MDELIKDMARKGKIQILKTFKYRGDNHLMAMIRLLDETALLKNVHLKSSDIYYPNRKFAIQNIFVCSTFNRRN